MNMFPSVIWNSTVWSQTIYYFQYSCYSYFFVILLFWFCDPSRIYFLLRSNCSIWIRKICTIICSDLNLAQLILWYISSFHLVNHTNILGANCSSILSESFATNLESCCGMINDPTEYQSITVCVAPVKFVIHLFLGVVFFCQYFSQAIILGLSLWCYWTLIEINLSFVWDSLAYFSVSFPYLVT